MSEEYIIPIFIYFLLPLIGLWLYLMLVNKMQQQEERPPVISLFIVFAVYGGSLQMILTALFWKWSGLASLGAIFLFLIAPLLMIGIAINNWNKKTNSVYHKWIHICSGMYLLFEGVLFCVLLLVAMKN